MRVYHKGFNISRRKDEGRVLEECAMAKLGGP